MVDSETRRAPEKMEAISLKVLMLGSAANVPEDLGEELSKRGVEVSYYRFNHFSRWRYLQAVSTPLSLALKDCDLVHAHVLRFPGYASYLSGKAYVVHCHGTDVRSTDLHSTMNRLKEAVLKHAKAVLYATPDLLEWLPKQFQTNAIYLPTPVPSRFRILHNGDRNGSLYFKREYEDDKFLDALGGEFQPITHIERFIPYEQMPNVLNQYKYLIDNRLPALSKVAFEALACGMKVLNWQNWVVDTFPKEHRVESVVDNLMEIYAEALA